MLSLFERTKFNKLIKVKLYQNLYYILFSSFIVVLGYLFFYQRTINGDSLIYTLGIDEINYIKMSNGQEVAFQLHKCRFFIPHIFKIIPFDAIYEFLALNLISLIFLFYGLIKLAKEYLINDKVIFLSLLIFLTTFSVSYNFSNLYLLDIPAIMTIIFFLISIIRKSFIYSLFWILISILIRETAIIFLPIFFIAFSNKKFFFSTLIILIFYLIPKIFISKTECISGIIDLKSISSLFETIFYIKGYMSYGSLWFLGMAGFYFFRCKDDMVYKITIFFTFLSILGTFISSMFSFSDITRMCLLMLPCLFLGSCFLLKKIIEIQNVFYFIISLIFFGFVLIANLIPNIIINGNFNSLDDFIISNSAVIVPLLILQIFVSIYLIIKYAKKILI